MTQTCEPTVAESFQGQPEDIRTCRSGASPSFPMDSCPLTGLAPAVWNDFRTDRFKDIGVGQSSPLHRTEEIQYGRTPQRVGHIPVKSMPSSSSSSSGSGPYSTNSTFYGSSAPPSRDTYGALHVSSSTNHNSNRTPYHVQDHVNALYYKEFREPNAVSLSARSSWEKYGNHKVTKAECHKALSDWFSNQVPRQSTSQERYYAMPPKYRSFSQDHLGDVPLNRGWPHSASQDTLIQPVHDSWNYRAKSEDYLTKHSRSIETLEQSALLSPHFEKIGWSSERIEGNRSSPVGQTARQYVQPVMYSSPGDVSNHVQKHPSQPNLQNCDEWGYVGYKSYSPSFHRRTGILNAFFFRDHNHGGPSVLSAPHRKFASPDVHSERSRSDSSSGTGASNVDMPLDFSVQQLESPPHLGAAHEDLVSLATSNGQSQAADKVQDQEDKKEAVVLRQKPPTGRKVPPPLRPVNVVFPVDLPDLPLIIPTAGLSDTKISKNTGENLEPLQVSDDSLALIPFIDEPTSPSIDLKAEHVPASAVVCSSTAPVIVTSPASPTFTFPITRHYSQDCGRKLSRRSSYLLAITTERSKSCDDGLNTYRDEGKNFQRPRRVASIQKLRNILTNGSLDSLSPTEDLRAKRHSTSDLTDVTFSDVRKEGWLYYKQVLTEKGKKVGGGLRQWRRVFAVLRSHCLYLHKDRREAVTQPSNQAEEEQPISVRACLVDISYRETKKKHVFRLTTADFCEYLFQAEDSDDMLEWVKLIRENSKSDNEDTGFPGQALINKKLYEYRKLSSSGVKSDTSPKGSRQTNVNAPRSPKHGPSSRDETSPPKAPWLFPSKKKKNKSPNRAFGVRLEDCQPAVSNKFIPLIVETCCKLVEEKGLEYTGIYRVPGNNAVVSTMQDQLSKGVMEIDTSEEKWQDLNVISSLLKSFFRKLPEPLFTNDRYNDFIDANRMDDARERLRTLKKLIHDLPSHYYETLKFLVSHLKTIANHSEKNKMEPRNLALVFGPTLVRTSEDNLTDMVTHMPDQYKIVETLIQHFDWFFSETEEKEEKTPEEDSDSQPVVNIEHLLPNIGRTTIPGDASDATNSDSAKSKGSWGSRKDPYNKEMLALSIISVVTRKRKKQEVKPCDSTDDESENETVKAAIKISTGDPGGVAGEGDVEKKCEKEEVSHSAQGRRSKELINSPELEKVSAIGNHASPFSTCSASHSRGMLPSGDLLHQEGRTGLSSEISGSSFSQREHEPSNIKMNYELELNSQRHDHSRVWDDQHGKIPPDTTSIVSGYSTLSTMDRSVCSEVQSVAESRGDEADDERSEFSQTDTESVFTSPSLLDASVSNCASRNSKLESGSTESSEGTERDRILVAKVVSRPSFNSHKLIKCDTLARKKLLRSKLEGDKTKNKVETDCTPTLPVEAEEQKSSKSSSSQESVRHQPEKSDISSVLSLKSSLTSQIKQRLKTSADDMFGVGLRKPHSPETRRKKSAWRRHTVVVHANFTDLNSNEWKEMEKHDITRGFRESKPSKSPSQHLGYHVDSDISMPTGGSYTPDSCTKTLLELKTDETGHIGLASDLHSNKDSGISSLESNRPKSSSSSVNNSVALFYGRLGDTDQHSRDMEVKSVTHSQPVKSPSRFHQYL
ncbi:rho GTPase-activating protein 23 isoform X1 [Protopterus annectens]|nr:rho GTPase-activating protein 23 isoform X1 [Protopterus annectens]